MNPTQMAAERFAEVWFYNIDYSDEALEAFKCSFQAAIEKATQELREQLRLADAAAKARNCIEEPKIKKADIQTTGEKIPYFGHMRKKP